MSILPICIIGCVARCALAGSGSPPLACPHNTPPARRAGPEGRGGIVRATMKHVAELAGVSIKTVSNVVNGHPYVNAQTRRRVEEAIE